LIDEQTGMVRGLEKELNVCAIALELGLDLAELGDEQLVRINGLEKELEIHLIVYREC